MRYFLITFITVICSTISHPTSVLYVSRYDNFDLDSMIRNERLLNAYTKCLLNKGGCTPDGIDLKQALPEAVKEGCSKCSERMKYGSRKVLTHLMTNKPHIYSELEKLYDPTGSYKKSFCHIARQENLQINACSF